MEDAQSKGFIAAKRIATATADDLAMSFENALQGQLVEGDVTPTQLVASGSNLIRAAPGRTPRLYAHSQGHGPGLDYGIPDR
jgi:hypothetical protein